MPTSIWPTFIATAATSTRPRKCWRRASRPIPTTRPSRRSYEDTQISRLKRAIESQIQRVLQYPEDTGAKAKLDQLNEMLNKYEIEAYRRRVNLHPEDAEAAFRVRRDPGANGRPRRGDRRVPASARRAPRTRSRLSIRRA